MPANLENLAMVTGLEKVSFVCFFFIPIPKKGNAKESLKYCTIVLISHASKIMLKILQAGFQQYMNWGFPNVQAGFRKGRRTRDQTANICWIMKKAREFQKNIYFCFIDYAKGFDCVVVWAFFGIALLWDWNENWPFPILRQLLSFPNLLE